MAKITLPENKAFIYAREGKQSVKIVEAKAVPTSKPQSIEITFLADNGGRVKNTYTLNSNDEKGFTVTCILLRALLGNDISEFDTDDVKYFVGKYLEVEIIHRTVPHRDDDTKTITFVNIAKILGKGTPFDTAESDRPRL